MPIKLPIGFTDLLFFTGTYSHDFSMKYFTISGIFNWIGKLVYVKIEFDFFVSFSLAKWTDLMSHSIWFFAEPLASESISWTWASCNAIGLYSLKRISNSILQLMEEKGDAVVACITFDFFSKQRSIFDKDILWKIYSF